MKRGQDHLSENYNLLSVISLFGNDFNQTYRKPYKGSLYLVVYTKKSRPKGIDYLEKEGMTSPLPRGTPSWSLDAFNGKNLGNTMCLILIPAITSITKIREFLGEDMNKTDILYVQVSYHTENRVMRAELIGPGI